MHIAVECVRLRLCCHLFGVPGAEDSRVVLQRWYVYTLPRYVHPDKNTTLVSTSTLAFDILACGACLLFPRYGCLDGLSSGNAVKYSW